MDSAQTVERAALAVAAFTGGLLAGLLLAPRSGRKMRRLIAKKAQAQSRWAEQRLHDVETQLSALEQQLRDAGAGLSDQLRDATQKAVEQVTPTVPDDPAAWSVEGREVASELRRMPRR